MVSWRWLTASALVAALIASDAAVGESPTTYSACPHRDTDPRSQGDAAKMALVPPGAYRVLLCRYHGLNSAVAQARTLAYSRKVTSTKRVRQLARQFNALKPWPSSGVVTTCPFDDESEVVAFFRNGRSADVPVSSKLNGCRSVTNGQIGRNGLRDPGPRLLRHLMRLTHCKIEEHGPWCAPL